jgi:hypothetical protein
VPPTARISLLPRSRSLHSYHPSLPALARGATPFLGFPQPLSVGTASLDPASHVRVVVSHEYPRASASGRRPSKILLRPRFSPIFSATHRAGRRSRRLSWVDQIFCASSAWRRLPLSPQKRICKTFLHNFRIVSGGCPASLWGSIANRREAPGPTAFPQYRSVPNVPRVRDFPFRSCELVRVLSARGFPRRGSFRLCARALMRASAVHPRGSRRPRQSNLGSLGRGLSAARH